MADSTVRDLDDLIAASAAVRKPFEGEAFLNLAFFAGKQWVAFDGYTLFEPALEDWRERIVDNRIRPFVRTEIAKMTKTRPQPVGVPVDQSDEAISGARYAEAVLDDAWVKADMQRKLRHALLWSRVAKAGFWKIWWDSTVGDGRDVLVYKAGHPEAGRSVKNSYGAPVPPDMLAELPPEFADMMEPRTVYSGEYCIELRTFFEVYPDAHCDEEGLEGAEHVCEEAVFSKEYVAKHFPGWESELKFDELPTAGIAESRWPGMNLRPDVPDIAKGVKLREYWSKTEHVVWTESGHILREEANPYGWHPYVMFSGTPVPGRFWPDCVVDDLRPRQVDLNKRLSQVAENAERIGNAPILVPTSMGDDWQWQGLPGEEIRFQDNGSPNAMPRFMDVPELGAYVREDIERCLASMMDISGQHEVSAGQVPAGVTAASAISMLQEQDDTRLGPDIADMENALAQAGRRILDLVDRYYDDQRSIRIAGEDGRWDSEAFRQNMLKGCQEIRYQGGMPQSKAAKQAAIFQMLNLFIQNGIPMSERDLGKALSEADVGGLEKFLASHDRTHRQVVDENRRLALGEPLPINSYDEDQAHIDEHTDFQRTARYQALPPQVKAGFEMHVALHRDRVLRATAVAGPPPETILPGTPSGGASSPLGAASAGPNGQSSPNGQVTSPSTAPSA